MSETEQITVAEASSGFGGVADAGTKISLPVVELLTGRGFVTGKSGSGKSNSASVVAEKLLDNGFGLLVVDIDGEYYGLKEEYEILHAGADEECDIQITADHAEKLASLALEQNVPIILDVSSYLDESEAEAVLTAVARSLFAKAKKQKQPFLLLVEEVHEYIPENGSVGECGRMLIKIGKRGRKHGLGICGISQRPADVKKDFITQCDWLLWHRLTWNNDTKVVGRILDNDYADAVENLNDGEGFLVTDWAESVQRVQFYRKQTFDAGATPGLDDFERPELKSVSDDLVSELQEISDEKQRQETRIQELREELDEKNSRIAELERELQDARDLSRMAEQFVDSLVEEVNGPQPGRTERERMRSSYVETDERPPSGRAESGKSSAETTQPATSAETTQPATSAENKQTGTAPDDTSDAGDAFGTGGMFGEDMGQTADGPDESNLFSENSGESQPATSDEDDSETAANPKGSDSFDTAGSTNQPVSAGSGEIASTDGGRGSVATRSNGAGEFSAEAIMDALNSVSETAPKDGKQNRGTAREEIEQSIRNDAEVVEDESDTTGSASESSSGQDIHDSTELVVRELKAEIAGLETKTRKMLNFYRELGPETPLNAHFSAGGDGSRTDAYSHNRRLRTLGLIEHAGRGHYRYRLQELLADKFEEKRLNIDDEQLDRYVAEIEADALTD